MAALLKLDAFIPYRLSVASNAVSRLIARAYEDRFGLKVAEWRLIAVLAEFGALSPAAIVRRTETDKVTVSRAGQALAARHLIQRLEDAADRRSHALELTEAGWRLYREVAPVALSLQAQVFAGFKPADLAALRKLLERIETAAGAALTKGE